jgi:hypothetical protein
MHTCTPTHSIESMHHRHVLARLSRLFRSAYRHKHMRTFFHEDILVTLLHQSMRHALVSCEVCLCQSMPHAHSAQYSGYVEIKPHVNGHARQFALASALNLHTRRCVKDILNQQHLATRCVSRMRHSAHSCISVARQFRCNRFSPNLLNCTRQTNTLAFVLKHLVAVCLQALRHMHIRAASDYPEQQVSTAHATTRSAQSLSCCALLVKVHMSRLEHLN